MLSLAVVYHVVTQTDWLPTLLAGLIGSIVGVVGALAAAYVLFKWESGADKEEAEKQRRADIDAAALQRDADLQSAQAQRKADRELAVEIARREAAVKVLSGLNTMQTTLIKAAPSSDAEQMIHALIQAGQDWNAANAVAFIVSLEVAQSVSALAATQWDTTLRDGETAAQFRARLREQMIDQGGRVQDSMNVTTSFLIESM